MSEEKRIVRPIDHVGMDSRDEASCSASSNHGDEPRALKASTSNLQA
jgi:hypothetical protein